MAATIPRRLFLVSGPAHARAVCLTFDDGPHPEHTPRLLDRLAALEVVATFFVVGERAARHPDLVRRVVAEGHALGHHSWSHGDPEVTSAQALADEARRTEALLASLTGQRPRLFRPPHGKLTAAKAARLWARRQTIVLWNRDPKDFAGAPLGAWVRAAGLSGGDVVLLHDVHPYAANALDELVDDVRGRGLRFTTPREWIGEGGP
jgi:peptidoglycan/xylan/chitin deacetylase (PgdA/CDA1 family)